MKSQDLRIGNYVQFNDDEDNGGLWLIPTEVIGLPSYVGEVDISSGKVYDLRLNQRILLERLEPIPLTQEWLERFGFELKDTNYDAGHHYYQLKASNGVLFITPFETEDTVYVSEIEYSKAATTVHQLQNLYFALTGEELTIKE